MTKQLIIEHTLNVINLLPNEKAEEISNFADLILKQYEEQHLNTGIQQLNSNSKAFEFLEQEEDSYTLSDLKVLYHGKR